MVALRLNSRANARHALRLAVCLSVCSTDWMAGCLFVSLPIYSSVRILDLFSWLWWRDMGRFLVCL